LDSILASSDIRSRFRGAAEEIVSDPTSKEHKIKDTRVNKTVKKVKKRLEKKVEKILLRF
jgi:hypothetical protein